MHTGNPIRSSSSSRLPFTPRPSPLSRQIDDKQLKSAVKGLKKDYPKLATLAARLNAVGLEHARVREEIMAEELAGVSTPARARYMNTGFVEACSNAPSVGEIRPTPLLAAFRSPLLAKLNSKYAAHTPESLENGDDSIEQARETGAGLEVEVEALSFGELIVYDHNLPDETDLPPLNESSTSEIPPAKTQSKRSRPGNIDDSEEEDSEIEDTDLSTNYSPDKDQTCASAKKRAKKGIKKAKVIRKSTEAEVAAGVMRKQKSSQLYADCFQVYDDYHSNSIEKLDELLEDEDRSAESYREEIIALRQEALDVKAAVAELRGTKYKKTSQPTPNADRLLRRGAHMDDRSEQGTPSHSRSR